ncbi:MAG: ornithine cyclodeaminase family protein [Clostridia bacterium]|nr:ornithine cyclodeaminase family protein [Clostridia bacterium]
MEIKVLNRKQLEEILEMPAVIEGVKGVYMAKANGDTAVWPLVEHHFPELNAVTDVRSGAVMGNINVHGLKMLNNYPGNTEKGLPAFSGMLMAFDSTNGMCLGIMDASYVTCMRTGAAGGISAAALSRKDAKTLMILGAGRQSIYQIGAALLLMPGIKRLVICDPFLPDGGKGYVEALPGNLKKQLNVERPDVEIVAEPNVEKAVGQADTVITITPSRKPAILREWIKPGTHFSCIGADMVGKEEIDPEIFRGARIFCDDIDQCLRVGECEIPAKTGVITRADVAGEIGDVLCGKIEGRTSDEQITIFDATGLAPLDLVTAKAAVQLAKEKGLGMTAEM